MAGSSQLGVVRADRAREVARKVASAALLGLPVWLLACAFRERERLLSALAPLFPVLRPVLERVRDRREKLELKRKRFEARGRRLAESRGPGEGDEGEGWAEALAVPKYEWRDLLNLRVIWWLAGRAREYCLSYLDGRGHVDELDMERLNLRKRWENQTMESIQELVGNTPMLAIHIKYMGQRRVVHMKCENTNLSGSLKDRMALHIIRRAYEEGRLRNGDVIAEASSGNTGISFSALGAAMGHPVVVYMPDWMSEERKALMRSYGAEIVEISRLQGGFVGSIRKAEEAKRDQERQGNRIFLPQQFRNELNAEAHLLTTGPEILMQLRGVGKRPAAFVAGVGTGGTIMGVSRCFRQHLAGGGVAVHPVEPAESPTLTTGSHQAGASGLLDMRSVGSHRIQGISDEFVPPVLKLEELSDVLAVPDGDAIIMAQKLARGLGIGAGISTGANLLAAVEAQERLGGDAVVVSLICDDNKKYLTTALAGKERTRPGYRSRHVELLRYEVIPALSGDALDALRDGTWKDSYTSEGLSGKTLLEKASQKASRARGRVAEGVWT